MYLHTYILLSDKAVYYYTALAVNNTIFNIIYIQRIITPVINYLKNNRIFRLKKGWNQEKK